MEPLLVYPDPPPPVLSQGLDLAGYPWTAVGGEADIERLEPADGWPGAVVLAVTNPEGAFAMCRALRKGDIPLEPVLLIASAEQLPHLDMREDLFDDFCVLPFQAPELDARLRQRRPDGGIARGRIGVVGAAEDRGPHSVCRRDLERADAVPVADDERGAGRPGTL